MAVRSGDVDYIWSAEANWQNEAIKGMKEPFDRIITLKKEGLSFYLGSASVLLRGINTPIGLRMLSVYDPYIWRDQIKAAYLVALGTNDEFYGLGSPNEMIKQFEGDRAFLAVDNLPHSWVSEKHLIAWRMWLNHAFYDRQIPGIDVKAERSDPKLQIKAMVTSHTDIRAVRLYYAFNQSRDWRFASWTPETMTRDKEMYFCELTLKKNEDLAYYVEVEDLDKHNKGLISSLVEIIPSS